MSNLEEKLYSVFMLDHSIEAIEKIEDQAIALKASGNLSDEEYHRCLEAMIYLKDAKKYIRKATRILRKSN